MPGSDTGSSTVQEDRHFGIENPTANSSKRTSLEYTTIERASERDVSDNDLEKSGTDATPQPPSAPPGLNPADFPDGGREAVS
jgi:hypothetical protein